MNRNASQMLGARRELVAMVFAAPILGEDREGVCDTDFLSLPDVSRERRCLQTSPEQLTHGHK